MKNPMPRPIQLLLAILALSSVPLVRAATPPPVDGNGIFKLNSGESEYFGYVPDTYNSNTPISLFVWMHGCGGQAYWDVFAIAPPATRANQSYIAISIGGRDGACWDTNADAPKVLAAIADVSRYFNIDPRRIFLGGYSSGGDMTYRVGFENAWRFAGLLAENSDPFRDTGSTRAALMAAASWKINVAHLAHTGDDVYPIAGVRASVATLQAMGFPATLIEKPGSHWDNDAGNFGTNYDLRTFLLPFLDAGWISPPLPRPKIKSRKVRRTVSNARIVLKGTSKYADSVEYKLKGKKYRTARGTTEKWKFPARLVPGKNVIRVRAVGPQKNSKILRFVIRRTASTLKP